MQDLMAPRICLGAERHISPETMTVCLVVSGKQEKYLINPVNPV